MILIKIIIQGFNLRGVWLFYECFHTQTIFSEQKMEKTLVTKKWRTIVMEKINTKKPIMYKVVQCRP